MATGPSARKGVARVPLVFVVPVIGVLFCPSGAVAGQQEMWTWVTQAVGELAEGRTLEAVESLGKARQELPVAELDAMVGLAALAGGAPGRALPLFQAAIKAGSTEPQVFYWAARSALAAGKQAEALRQMERALALGGDRPELRVGQAMLLAAARRHDEAASALAQVAAAEPNLLEPSLYPTPVQGAVELLGAMLRGYPHQDQLARTQGHLLWRAGYVLPAMNKFTGLLKKNPGDAGALQMLAQCRARLGQPAEALQMARRAADLAPDQGEVRATLGELLLRDGKPSEAMKQLRVAADALPREAAVLSTLGRACQEAEDTECAERFFRHALERDGRRAEAQFGLALILSQKKAQGAGAQEVPREVRARFQAALQLDPGNPRYLRAAAHFLSLQGERVGAARLLAQARRAARAEQLLMRKVKQVEVLMARQLKLLRSLAEDPGCAGEACRRMLRGEASPAGSFIRAHLALAGGRTEEALRLLGPLARRMRWRQLLDGDPLRVGQEAGKASAHAGHLERVFPMVPPGVFR